VEAVKRRLLEGELKPGDQLPTIAQYARELEVGQASVREAYRTLANFGLLAVTQGRGTYVASTFSTGRDLLQIFQLSGQPTRMHLLEARKLIEPGAAALAAQRASHVEAEAILRAAREEEAEHSHAGRWIEMNLRFHDLIMLAAHNPVLSQMLKAVRELMHDSQPHAAEIPSVREKGRHFHKLIAMAIDEGNANSAQVLMRQHIESVEEELVNLAWSEESKSHLS